MTIGIGIVEKPSLLAAILNGETAGHSARAAASRPDGIFAGKLDTILSAGNQDTTATRDKARSLAEALKLQMLQTTLSLAGDPPAETPRQLPFSGRSPAMHALIKAYGEQQPETEPLTQTAMETRQPLPELSAATPPGKSQTAAGSPQTAWLEPIIAKASSHYGVDMGLIKAVIKAESNFNPQAVSHAGARGLMQLMPGTARSLGVNDSFDPEQNVMAGTRFLRDLLKRYQGDLDSALAAYNWGPGNVDRRPERLPRETRDYLARVKQLYSSYSA